MRGWYILDALGNPQPVAGLSEWAMWQACHERHVAITEIGDSQISTVFLGWNHDFLGGPPLLWETIVFGGKLNGEMKRYSTLDEAKKGHDEMVGKVTRESLPRAPRSAMKKLSVIAVCLALSAPAHAQLSNDMSTAKVAGHEWVDVKNLEPVSSQNSSFVFGDSCSINQSGTVTIVGLVEADSLPQRMGDPAQLLVRYAQPGGAYGERCPTGTLFLMTQGEFLTSTDRHERAKLRMISERDGIRRVLEDRSAQAKRNFAVKPNVPRTCERDGNLLIAEPRKDGEGDVHTWIYCPHCSEVIGIVLGEFKFDE